MIVSGSYNEGTVRVWRLADGTPVGKPLRHGGVHAVATGALPDGTPVIISGSYNEHHEETVWVWQLADGTPVGKPLRHGGVLAVAAGRRRTARR